MASNSIAVILTIIVFLISWKIILPSYSNNKAEAEKLSAEVSDAKNEIASIEEAKSSLSSISDTINELLIAVPSDNDEPNLISEIEAMATKNSLAVPSIDIAPAISTTEGEGAETVTAGNLLNVSFSVSGSFENISAFTDTIEKSIKFMRIKALSMTSPEENIISASYTLEVYTRGSVSAGETQ